MHLNRVYRVQHSAERIIDLMRHTGRKPTKHRAPFLFGELRGQVLALDKSERHRIESVK